MTIERDMPPVSDRIPAPPSRVHMVGICGVGMAGVAHLLSEHGYAVNGCDAAAARLGGWLGDQGISCTVGHDPAHVAGADWLVRTAAVSPAHPEVEAARAAGKPVFTRGQVLAQLIERYTSIAVSGTHGKTTTSSFIACVLAGLGRSPSWCIGGEPAPGAGMGVAGSGEGGLIVVEADESDGSAALYEPDIAVVTNVEYDHMEHFESEAAFVNCFRTFARRARRLVVYGSDDALACRAAQGVRRGVSYGFGPEADLRAQPLPAGNGCALSCHGQDLGDLRLAVPGDHNMLNALACVAVLMELGIPFDAIASELEQVGLPKRRFETVVSTGATRVISDYAHHPSEIRALVRTARSLAPGRLLAVFQPHRYTRTLALGPDFPHAFRGIDDLVLTPVYAASEKPLPGGDLADLYVRFRQTGTTDGPVVRLADSLDAAWSYLCRAVTADDWLLIVGAGDIEILADRARRDAGRLGGGASTAAGMVESLRAAGVSGDTLLAANEPLAARTSLGVGGVAEVWAEVATEDDLARLAGWCRQRACPLQLLGAGSNVLISDLGVPGVTARLTGRPFREIRASAPGTVCAGAAVPLPRLLDWCEAHHLSGLECLEGIPATVGGAVAMNAGAWGDAIGPHVTRIHALNRAGEPCIVHEKDLTPEYRSIKGFGDRIITSVVFALAQAGPGTVRERRSVCAGRREWWRGLRSAGSVFRNPPGDFAGRLCDASGLKGRTVGGAQVSEQHANVIVTGSSATASDVEALMMQMETAVRRDSDIRLEREIVLWPPRIR